MRYRVNLLDTWIDKVDLTEAVSELEAFVRSGVSHRVVTANVDFLRLGRDNAAFRELMNSADLVVPDGMPLLWAARFLGDPLPERVTGVDLMVECARLSAAKGFSLFLLGAAPGVAEEAAATLRTRFPGVRIVGTYAPPIGPFSAAEEETMVRMIQEMNPDMLFVAFGAPKQDEWILTHMHRLNVPVCMGVGMSFDVLAGRVSRAPVWMQNRGLEWLYRVMQEPTRLWKRYFVDDLPVFFQLMAQRRTGSPNARTVTGLLSDYVAGEQGGGITVGLDAVPAKGTGAHVA